MFNILMCLYFSADRWLWPDGEVHHTRTARYRYPLLFQYITVTTPVTILSGNYASARTHTLSSFEVQLSLLNNAVIKQTYLSGRMLTEVDCRQKSLFTFSDKNLIKTIKGTRNVGLQFVTYTAWRECFF